MIANYLIILKYVLNPLIQYGGNQKEFDLLKVKWLAALIIAFVAPVIVFVFNQTSEYHILRFNGDPLTIALLLVGTSIHFYLNIIKNSHADVN